MNSGSGILDFHEESFLEFMNFLNMLLFLRHKFDGKFPEIHENHQSNS